MKDRRRNFGGRVLTYLMLPALVLSSAASGQTADGVFDFNDRTRQGWTMEGAFIGEDGPFPSNFTAGWSDEYNYPSALDADPVGDSQGSFEMYTPGGHGLDNVENWWRMVIKSPDLTASIPWQNAMGYSVKIGKDFPGSGAQIYVNLMIVVYDLDLRHERYFTTGVATAVPQGVWTERAFIRPSWGFPNNYIVREVFVNVWGWIPYGPWLYEGGLYVDDVTPIKDEYMYVDDDGGGPHEDGSRTYPFDTIQEAIDAVELGKHVVIRDGLYQGLGNRDIDFKGKAITVRSENGPVNCVIDCEGTAIEHHRGFVFSRQENPNSVLMGVTIQNGYTSRGGGIYCLDSDPTIADCSIVSNTATNLGGGIYNENSSPIIEGCYFTHNRADYGGAIYGDSGSNAVIRSCALVDNLADYGGGVSCNDSTMTLSTVTITDNTATTSGGAIYSSSHGNANISNSIIWGNTPNAIYLVSGAATVDYSNIQGGWGGAGNINQDPELMADNYHLDINSPCIDVGDPLGVFTDQTDIDGHPRVIGSRVDMGANEFSPQIHNQTQDSYHYTIQESINAAQVGDTVVVSDGVYNGTGNRDINFYGKELTLKSENGADLCIIDCQGTSGSHHRGFQFNHPRDVNSVLDGFTVRQGYSLHGSGIWCINSSPTIQNCKIIFNLANDEGGGISCNNCAPVIRNCTIHSNTTHYGGGICLSDSDPLIINCTLHSNTADWGGGLYCGGDSVATIRNSILWGDTATHGGPEIMLGTKYNPSTLTVSHCVVEGGKDAVVAEGDSRLRWFLGNQDVDPGMTPDGHLRKGSVCIDAGTSADAPAFDRDGETRPHVWYDIGSDEYVDKEGDGLPDWWEKRYFGHITIASAGNDEEFDGLRNIEEYELFSSHPTAPLYYADPVLGDDDYNGLAPTWQGGHVGPKATLQAALNVAGDGDTILAAAGTYAGAGNKNIDFNGKPVILRAPDGTAATTIDCEDEGRFSYFHSGETPATAIIGFTITNGDEKVGGAIYSLRSHAQFIDCAITGNNAIYGGGIYSRWSMLTFTDCTISNNTPEGVWMQTSGGARVYGTNFITDNDWQGTNLRFSGDGALQMSSATVFDWDNSWIRCDLSGPGMIKVDYGAYLIIEGDATVDLDGGGANGSIQCDGLLHVRGNAQLSNANIDVTRANFEGDVSILNNVINADAGAPYGQFFIEDSVQISHNEIHADGDRYMDLDASVFDGLIADNEIYVTITEGVGGVRGGLLELRGKKDMVETYTPDPCNAFFCQVAPGTIPDFDPDSWMIQELKLIDDAKVNLTNRFDFQPPFDAGGDEEVIYVKNLILGAHAVLNTSFNKIYCENLIAEPNAVIQNVPLLGFSLSNIELDDEVEFLTRVVHNNLIDEEQPQYNRMHIERVEGLAPDPGGMMRLTNLMDFDPRSPTYLQNITARTKGLFAKANEDQILILFEYLFDDPDPNMELVVYLSDVPQLQDVRDPNHHVEVARLKAPPADRPGAYGSGRFGVLQKFVSPGDLDFIRGVRMELELEGPVGGNVLINNWDPMVLCDPMQLYCKDVTGEFGVTAKDFLYIFGEYGNSASPTSDMTAPLGRACLDGSFNKDGYVDLNDLMEWDWFLSPPERLNNCDIPLTPGPSSYSMSDDQKNAYSAANDDVYLPIPDVLDAADDLTESFLIASKWIHNISPYYLQDTIHTFDPSGQAVGSAPPAFDHKSSRLVTDKSGGVYQIHMENGLVEFSNPSVPVVAPGSFSDVTEPRFGQSATVYLGLQQQGNDWAGRPLVDAAFDEQGFIYVLPVVVAPVSNPDAAYLAAAKLQPLPGQTPNYSLVALFDDPPLPADNQQRNALREIEVDDNGNLYVVNSHDLNESDILWVFDTETAAVKQRLNLIDRSIPAPSAMHISGDGDTLYLTSSQNSPDAVSSILAGLSTTDLTVVRSVTINDMGHITTIAEDPANGSIWTAGFKMANIPQYPDPSYPPFYFPYLAEVPVGSDNPISAVALSGASNMSVPMSMVWIGETADQCGGADLDGNDLVNLTDLSILLSYWLDTDCIPPDDCGQANLDNSDTKNTVNLLDFAWFTQYWLKIDC